MARMPRCAGWFTATPVRLAAVAISCMVVLLAGCGGSETPQPSSVKATKSTAAPAPTYRAGQYCKPKREKTFRRFGFTCDQQHLWPV